MIVLDLEWNRGYDKKPLDEILQIGAVRYDETQRRIVDSFSVCIKPVVHAKMDVGARKLPMLAQYKAEGTTFPRAMSAFCRWCGQDRDFAAWGPDDLKVLEQNCAYYHMPPMEDITLRNVQMAYSHAVGSDGRQQIALWRAVAYCGIPDVFCYHNALYDAMYTALLCRWLRPEDWDFRPEKKAPKTAAQRRRSAGSRKRKKSTSPQAAPQRSAAAENPAPPQAAPAADGTAPAKKRRRHRGGRKHRRKPAAAPANAK